MRALAIGLLCIGLGACDTPNFRTAQFQFGSSATLAATGNLRFVSERTRELADGARHQVVCTEPSPDYAVGATTEVEVSAKSTVPEAGTLEGEGKLKAAELVTQLNGRSKGVLALRDGLYAACQAYSNGQIGKDAYSVILSQYGYLLVALMNETSSNATSTNNPNVVAAITKEQRAASAFSAVLVACINGNDPTRAVTDGDRRNPLLGRDFCRRVVARAGRV